MEKKLKGDFQDELSNPDAIVAHDLCIRIQEDGDNECKFRDIDGRCAFEHCIYDGYELPNITKKFMTRCVICTKEFEMDPRFMKAHICTSCLQRIQKAEKLPFTCICCGTQQDKPSIIPFSSICDYCVSYKLFNTSCVRYLEGPPCAGANMSGMGKVDDLSQPF